MYSVRVMIKFCLEQYEDCSLRDSTSDSSEKLFQGGRGEGEYIYDFGKRGVCAIKHVYYYYFLKVFCWSHEASSSHEKQSSP